MIADKPWSYTDTTDAFGHTLLVRPVEASTYDGTVPVVSLSVRANEEASDLEPIVYVRVEDAEDVLAAIRSAKSTFAPTAPHTPDREHEIRARADLESKLYDSIAAFNAVACWDVLRLPQMRQYLAEHLAATVGADRNAAVAVEVRRALEGAAHVLEEMGYDDAEAVVRYLSTPYTDDTATASPAREQGEGDFDRMTPQSCSKGFHADWAVDSEDDHTCPWCRIAELEARTATPEVSR